MILRLNLAASEKRIQNPIAHSPDANSFSRFTPCMSADPVSSARSVKGVGTALSVRKEQALLDWITVNSR